jgi:hypothetical protein
MGCNAAKIETNTQRIALRPANRTKKKVEKEKQKKREENLREEAQSEKPKRYFGRKLNFQQSQRRNFSCCLHFSAVCIHTSLLGTRQSTLVMATCSNKLHSISLNSRNSSFRISPPQTTDTVKIP